MKHILVSGASGTVGRFITARLAEDGHKVTCLGRKPVELDGVAFHAWDLADEEVTLPEADALVHAALSHVPGKYRDGEGDDPHSFIELNVGGAIRILEAAKLAGIRHAVCLSSDAVYANSGNWAVLKEDAELGPDSLYGQVKIAAEMALENLCDETFAGTALRLASVYGTPPGRSRDKWASLFSAYARGAKIEPHLGTEVHGEDVASAVSLVLESERPDGAVFDIFNVSDLLLDRHELLSLYASEMAIPVPPPARAPGPLGVLEPGKLKVLGWNPGGKAKLENHISSLCVTPQGAAGAR